MYTDIHISVHTSVHICTYIYIYVKEDNLQMVTIWEKREPPNVHSCVALLEQWEPSAGVAMEMETLLRWTPSPGPAPQRERQPGSSQRPHGSVPSASRTCRHLSFLRIILIPVPLPSSQDAIPWGLISHQLPLLGQDPLLHGPGQQLMLDVTQHWGQGDIWGETVWGVSAYFPTVN